MDRKLKSLQQNFFLLPAISADFDKKKICCKYIFLLFLDKQIIYLPVDVE